MSERFKTYKQNLLLLIVSISITAIFAELVLRAVLPAPIYWQHPQEQYQYDAEINHWLKGNQHAFTHNKPVSINSKGIRDFDYSPHAAPDVYRILGIGDSQTFGNGLELADTWPKQLEARLNQPGEAKSVEVINAGVPGSDTWQHEIILKRLLAIYHPDAVVLAFYVNDVVLSFKPSPAPQIAGNDQLIKQAGYILKSSALLLTLRIASDAIGQWWSPSKGAALQKAVLKGELTPVITKRWKQVERSLAAIKVACDESNTKFGIVILPRRDQVSNQTPWQEYGNHLINIAKQHQIPIVNTTKLMQEAYKTHGKELFIPWDGHNTKIANGIIAKKIADDLAVIKSDK